LLLEERMSTQRIKIVFIGIDAWDRAVFRSQQGERFFKTIELMPHCAFADLAPAGQAMLLRSLHTTDSVDGEPDYPVSCTHFQVVSGEEQS
jgi:hypothetical protein